MSDSLQPSPMAPERPVLAGRTRGDRAARAIAVVGIVAALTAALFAWDARHAACALKSSLVAASLLRRTAASDSSRRPCA